MTTLPFKNNVLTQRDALSITARLFALALAMVWIVNVPPAFAAGEPSAWQSLVTNGDLPLKDGVADPTTPGRSYATADTGDAYRRDTPTSEWVSIVDNFSPEVYQSFGIESLAVDYQTPGKLYALCAKYLEADLRLYTSLDAGSTWTQGTLPAGIRGKIGTRCGQRLVLDPNHPLVLYLATPNKGLWQSVDSATSWTRVTSLNNGKDVDVAFVAADVGGGTITVGGQTVSKILYSGIHSTDATSGGIWKSTDGGQAWSQMTGGALTPKQGRVASDGTFYATFNNDVGVCKAAREANTLTDITPAGVVGVAGQQDYCAGLSALNDGAYGASGSDPSKACAAGGAAENVLSQVTYRLDTSVNVNGYDISAINTFASWNFKRQNQAYTVSVHVVGEAEGVFHDLPVVSYLVGEWTPNSKVSITSASGETLVADGVDQVRFTFVNLGQSFNVYRELDVVGVPSVGTGTGVKGTPVLAKVSGGAVYEVSNSDLLQTSLAGYTASPGQAFPAAFLSVDPVNPNAVLVSQDKNEGAYTCQSISGGKSWKQIGGPRKGVPAIAEAPTAERVLQDHEAYVTRAKEGLQYPVNVVFFGDSITQRWGWEHFNEFYKNPLRAANFGIGGDVVQGLLWRILHGEMEVIKPKVAVLLIGTNNVGANTPEQIAAGIAKTIATIRAKCPTTKVLLIGLFPRTDYKSLCDRAWAVNDIIATFDDGGQTVRFLNPGEQFLNPDRSVKSGLLHDGLHLTTAGYTIWHNAMYPVLNEMLGNTLPDPDPDPDPLPADLPDPLMSNAGTSITTVADWEATRRPEILELFENYVYGRRPVERPADLRFELKSINTNAMGGKATLKLIEIHFSGPGGAGIIKLTVFVPNHVTGPVPGFLVLCNGNINKIDPTRTIKSPFWPAERLIERGYAAIAYSNEDLDPDTNDGFKNGVHGIFDATPRGPDAWGTISAWAWGASRIMDYLETDPDINASHIGMVGHSRGGKTALWVGATDQRFALAVSNDSGCTGAALSRNKKGERLLDINNQFPHWFCTNYKAFNGLEETLPIDQHELIALIAPRLVYVASASRDDWADPEGEFLSCVYAGLVYELYGLQGVGATTFPPVEQPLQTGSIGHHIRIGDHDLVEYDWDRYMDFADKHWGVPSLPPPPPPPPVVDEPFVEPNISMEKNGNVGYTVATDDLLQTSLAGSLGCVYIGRGNNDTAGTVAVLNDGSFGKIAGANSTITMCGPTNQANACYVLVYTLDTASHTAGYTITEIATYGGWQQENRNDQKYVVDFHRVGTPSGSFTNSISVHYAVADWGGPSTKVSITPGEGATRLVRGVDQVRFTFAKIKWNYNGYREIDVLGFPVPPKTTILILA